MRYSELLLLASATIVSAWLPGSDKSLVRRDGIDLFENSTLSVTGRSASRRWLPGNNAKIRGVNLGSQFIVEPWMSSSEWSKMGCGGKASEFDCVSALGQAKADAAFKEHWATWITQSDLQEMVSYGLNTIRIPVGYWIREDLKYSSEHFPNGGLAYLEKICGWASDLGMYIIIDLHGAPYAQLAHNAFTGQDAPSAGFFQSSQYERAYQFLEWMTEIIHNNPGKNYRNVGMLEVLNEPDRNSNVYKDMITNYYPNAYAKLQIKANDYLHIQFMNKKWTGVDPAPVLKNNYFAAYDDHRYLKYDTSVAVNHDSYIRSSCNDDRGGNVPTIVGEFSLSVPDNVEGTDGWKVSNNKDFYTRWFGAQLHSYEKQYGWIYWSWKTNLNDARWGYKDAVAQGVIPKNLANLPNPC